MKRILSVPEQHQRRIAIQTFQLHEIAASIMGGPNHKEAVRILRGFVHSDADIHTRLTKAGHDKDAIARFMS